MKKENQSGMDLLRFITLGSVDDGKSTLIGRLMYDTKSIFQDQLEAIEESSRRRGDGHVNLALLTDGLKAEREQGITIDVAYRYFATTRRKFIMADAPGHIQYTRNMVTGASTAELAIILIDARSGLSEQTRRHSYIASLLGIQHVIVAINKMDLVDFSEERFERIKREYLDFSAQLGIPDISFIPVSALAGDNVVDPSARMPWYSGKSLLETLETVNVTSDQNQEDAPARFPVQRVIRPQSAEHPDFRGYAGRVEGGVFRPGDAVTILPSGIRTEIKDIFSYKTGLSEASSSMSVIITLADEVDVSRGDMIVRNDDQPSAKHEFEAIISWFNDRPLRPSGKYIVKHTTNETAALVKGVSYKIDVNTLGQATDDLEVRKNDIAKVTIKAAKPVLLDAYAKNRVTGSIILIDEFTNETVAAGMIQ